MIPERVMVGVGVIASEKVAVIVTSSLLETMLSKSVCVKSTVGGRSIEKVMLSVPVYSNPAKSFPETVAVVEVTVEPETVQV